MKWVIKLGLITFALAALVGGAFAFAAEGNWENASSIKENEVFAFKLEEEASEVWVKLETKTPGSLVDLFFKTQSGEETSFWAFRHEVFREADLKSETPQGVIGFAENTTFLAAAPGTYYVKLYLGRSGEPSDLVYEMHFMLEKGWENAEVMAMDQTYEFGFTKANQSIWYRFTTTKAYEPVNLVFDSSYGEGMGGPVLQLFLTEGFRYSVLSESDFMATSGGQMSHHTVTTSDVVMVPENDHYEFVRPGTYYVRLMPMVDLNGTYEIKRTTFEPDAYLLNRSLKEAYPAIKDENMRFINSKVFLSSQDWEKNGSTSHWFKFATKKPNEEVTFQFALDDFALMDYEIYQLDDIEVVEDLGFVLVRYNTLTDRNEIVNALHSGSDMIDYESWEQPKSQTYVLESPGTYYVRATSSYNELPIDIQVNVSYSDDKSANDESTKDEIAVRINGQPLILSEPPLVMEGRTLVPMRALFEALGADVEWTAETQTILATKGDVGITIVIGSKVTKVGLKEVLIDVPAQLIGGRTYVPLRFIGEALGEKVKWQAESKTILIGE